MTKTILVTGATDGIGLLTAEKLGALGHTLLLHGRSQAKLDAAVAAVQQAAPEAVVETYLADLSDFAAVDALASEVKSAHERLDVLINNAGVFKTPEPVLANGIDIRFMVNTFAPYRLTQLLLPLLDASGRIVNLSSAAQAPVDIAAMNGGAPLDDYSAYGQSKLAITMWSADLAEKLGDEGPAVYAVNPGSLLATKMVTEGFNVPGSDVNIGADILVEASLADEWATKSGAYYDNDNQQFAPPHADCADPNKVAEVVSTIAEICK